MEFLEVMASSVACRYYLGMTLDLMPKSDAEQLREIEALLGAIIRKAELRAGQEPVVIELADLARRCEALVKDLVRNSTN